MKVIRLLMDHLEAPCGIDHVPEFCWIVECDRVNAFQTAYHLQASLSQDFSAPVYDSGIVQSGDSAHVHADFPLTPCSTVFVRVKVWSGEACTDWYTASFLTGMLGQWQAGFISAETEADWDHSSGTFLRKSITLDKPVKQAVLCTTAHGLYHVSLNGVKVGQDQLAPGWTSYDHHLCYQTHDVTSMLIAGENVIGAHVGAGWYKGEMGFIHERCSYGRRTDFLAELTIRYADGSEQHIVTDESWIGCASPVTFSEIYDGERYDARLEQPGWDRPGFVPVMADQALDGQITAREPEPEPHSNELKSAMNRYASEWQPADTLWRHALPVGHDLSLLCAQPGARVTIEQELSPTLIITPKGDRVLDFGQNLAGILRIRARGKRGEQLHLRCFETLDAAGNAYFDNMRSARSELIYTCGGQEETYQEQFTYHGFRYVKLEQWPDAFDPQDVTACVAFSQMRQIGHFACSDERLNQLQHNIEWSMRGNFVDIPTDCPQRDERMGWTGDAQIFCRTAASIRDTLPFFKKWLKDVAFDQTAEGGVPHVVPNLLALHTITDWLLGQGIHSASAWADVAVLAPWMLYLTYGDQGILVQQFDSMRRWIDFMRANSNDLIWNYKLQFGDWVALDAEEGSYFGATPNDLTCTAYFAWSTGIFAKSCRALGRDLLAAEYEDLAQRIIAKFRAAFFDSNGHLTVQTQTAHVLALYFHLAPDSCRMVVTEDLRRLIAERGGHLVTGFVGTPYITHALSQNGYVGEAYDLLLREDFPSWLYQVRAGATTIWEHWDGIKPDGTMWSPNMNSFNHYAYGAIGEWMYRVMAGLEADEADPGYHHAIISPKTDPRLQWVEYSIESMYGSVGVRWERHEDRVSLRVTVPFNASATLILEDGAQDLQSTEAQDQHEPIELGSGVWHFTYRVN